MSLRGEKSQVAGTYEYDNTDALPRGGPEVVGEADCQE